MLYSVFGLHSERCGLFSFLSAVGYGVNREPLRKGYKVKSQFFGRPFVKRFALCYQTVVCLSVCPVCL